MIKHECETCEKSKHYKKGDKVDMHSNIYIVDFPCSICTPHGRAYTYDCELWEEKKTK